MEVGEYVRTKRGIIGKIKLIDNQTALEDLYLVKRQWYFKEDFIKSSPNIIDLIDGGDYVNGRYVLDFETLQTKEPAIIVDGLVTYGWGQGVIPVSEIKSIVTKEMYLSVEYRVENN